MLLVSQLLLQQQQRVLLGPLSYPLQQVLLESKKLCHGASKRLKKDTNDEKGPNGNLSSKLISKKRLRYLPGPDYLRRLVTERHRSRGLKKLPSAGQKTRLKI